MATDEITSKALFYRAFMGFIEDLSSDSTAIRAILFRIATQGTFWSDLATYNWGRSWAATWAVAANDKDLGS